ncbi:hypothetical protein AGMMS49574_29700 [Bacteroidia bacterium]|nr:hypothetical protein AGMMS49574_29700 [Bacteroidia bacterium]GHV04106.1 hypothetical protein FACS189416_1760 [Bacteroidia bacterium]
MSKISIITVQDIQISIATENNDDYICLTDMVKGQEGEDHIRNRMRNRNNRVSQHMGIDAQPGI